MVHKYKVVLFGGATGDTGKYSMTGETYIFNILLKTWTELNGKYLFLLFKSRESHLHQELLMLQPMLSKCKWSSTEEQPAAAV
jgi:hypothetical protein